MASWKSLNLVRYLSICFPAIITNPPLFASPASHVSWNQRRHQKVEAAEAGCINKYQSQNWYLYDHVSTLCLGPQLKPCILWLLIRSSYRMYRQRYIDHINHHVGWYSPWETSPFARSILLPYLRWVSLHSLPIWDIKRYDNFPY